MSGNAKEILHLGVFNDLRGLVPAMNIALETIENDTTLPFSFNVAYNFTMVSHMLTCIASWCSSYCLKVFICHNNHAQSIIPYAAELYN